MVNWFQIEILHSVLLKITLFSSMPVDVVSQKQQAKMVNLVYRTMKKCSDGADDGVVGFNGSVTASSLVKILNSIHAPRHNFVDLGAGAGRVILAALAIGANTSVGVELPENVSQTILFRSARHMLQSKLEVEGVDWSRAEWTPRDINLGSVSVK